MSFDTSSGAVSRLFSRDGGLAMCECSVVEGRKVLLTGA